MLLSGVKPKTFPISVIGYFTQSVTPVGKLEKKEIQVLLSGVEPKNVMHSESANGGHIKEF